MAAVAARAVDKVRQAVAADVTDCAKTPRQPATLEKRPPQFRYGAFSLAARGPRTLFSFFQNAISEFSHSLVRRRISRRIARLYASSRRRLPFLSDRALVNRRGLNIASKCEIPAGLLVSNDFGRSCSTSREC